MSYKISDLPVNAIDVIVTDIEGNPHRYPKALVVRDAGDPSLSVTSAQDGRVLACYAGGGWRSFEIEISAGAAIDAIRNADEKFQSFEVYDNPPRLLQSGQIVRFDGNLFCIHRAYSDKHNRPLYDLKALQVNAQDDLCAVLGKDITPLVPTAFVPNL